MIYLEMAKYVLILLVMAFIAGWLLRAWFKAQGVKGMASDTISLLSIIAIFTAAVVTLLGKVALIFASAGVKADEETDRSDEEFLSGPLVLDADTFDADGCFKDSKGNIYL